MNMEPLPAWNRVQRAVAYKRDLSSHDLICIELQFDDGTTRVIDEECDGFAELMAQMNRALPGVPQEWYFDIMLPAFEATPTLLFERTRGQG
jgi:hypothetical protein